MSAPPAGDSKTARDGLPITARLLGVQKTFWSSFGLLTTLFLGMFCVHFARDPRSFALTFVLWCILGGFVYLISRRDRGAPGQLEVSMDGVYLDRRLCTRGDIDTALLLPRGRNKPLVSLKRRRGSPTLLEVDGAEDGRALIRALALDPHQAVTTF